VAVAIACTLTSVKWIRNYNTPPRLPALEKVNFNVGRHGKALLYYSTHSRAGNYSGILHVWLLTPLLWITIELPHDECLDRGMMVVREVITKWKAWAQHSRSSSNSWLESSLFVILLLWALIGKLGWDSSCSRKRMKNPKYVLLVLFPISLSLLVSG